MEVAQLSCLTADQEDQLAGRPQTSHNTIVDQEHMHEQGNMWHTRQAKEHTDMESHRHVSINFYTLRLIPSRSINHVV